MAMMRAKHSRAGSNRNTFRVISIMIIFIGIIGLLVVLQYMASELSSHRPAEKTTPGLSTDTETK